MRSNNKKKVVFDALLAEEAGELLSDKRAGVFF